MRFDRYLLKYTLGKAFTHLLDQGEEEARSLLVKCGFTVQDGIYTKDTERHMLGVYFEDGKLKHFVHYHRNVEE